VKKRKSITESNLPQDVEPAAAALQEIGNSPEPIRTRRTSLQRNVQWRNENVTKKTTEQRYQLAFKAATTIFHQKKLDPLSDRRSQQAIIDNLNEEYHLSGVNKENSREKNMLSLPPSSATSQIV
jgi:type VI protein secretion system component VasK